MDPGADYPLRLYSYFVSGWVVLVGLKVAAEACLDEGIVEGDFELGTVTLEVFLEGLGNGLQALRGERTILIGVDCAQDPRHVDAFGLCV